MIQEDPTVKIEMPKIGRSLPKSLTEMEVESLLAAPEVTDPLGHRDRAMLEVLYATGLRVSELINLKQNQVNLNQGVLRIRGKGDRERLIPLGEESQRWSVNHDGATGGNPPERQSEYLFPTAGETRMTRQAFWTSSSAMRRRRTSTASSRPILFATPLPRTSEQRRRPARRADAAGPQRLVDHQIYTHVARERMKELHAQHHPRG